MIVPAELVDPPSVIVVSTNNSQRNTFQQQSLAEGKLPEVFKCRSLSEDEGICGPKENGTLEIESLATQEEIVGTEFGSVLLGNS